MKIIKLLIGLAAIILLGYFLLHKISKDESFQLFGDLVSRVETNKKIVALTFDDGPTPGKTEKILEILKHNDIKATFYLTGDAMSKNMVQAKAIVSSGHEVGNHSFTHQRMMFKSLDFVREELEKTDALIRQAGYTKDITFRPPYGRKLFVLPYYLMDNGTQTVTWDVEPDSALPLKTTPDALISHALDKITPGSIILMHVMFESRKNSMAAIPGMIRTLKQQGYEFMTVSELLEQREGAP